MNSSPPPPSFTLPPLNSSGRPPITPSPTPSPDEERDGHDFRIPGSAGKGKGKAETHDLGPDGGRISMYVRLFDEMIETVLASESYLFTEREQWVLRHVLALPYEPHYLLTRLLLRRTCKIHPLSSLINSYSAELGEEGVERAMRALAAPLPIPEVVKISDPPSDPGPSWQTPTPTTPLQPAKSYPTPLSHRAQSKPREPSGKAGPAGPSSSKAKRKNSKPWADLSTGLSAAEEKADPALAEAIRESLWAAKVGRVELDDDGRVLRTPSRPLTSRSGSGSSSASSSSATSTSTSKKRLDPKWTEEFSLSPRRPHPIWRLGKNESELTLEEVMSCIPADDLRKVARARKVPPVNLLNRQAVENALRGLAKSQSVLGFTPLKGIARVAEGQSMLPFSPSARMTSESLLILSLLPYLGKHAIQLSPEIHDLAARVNLIFSRTPPSTTQQASLMLPSILVSSHKRRYPEYGPPTRSRIWSSRNELLVWERAVYWEALTCDALGDTWSQMGQPGFKPEQMLPRKEGAVVAKRVFEGVFPVWLAMIAGDEGKSVDVAKQEGGLVGDRFKTGHVLTRTVYKAANALGVLHEYDLECQVLRALLQQRRWRRGRRGAWYDRLALVLMNHYNTNPEEKEAKLREATQVCIDGLLDEDTHLIYRPALSRRLTRLENKLDLPADERHISYAGLLQCETRELVAPRVPENMGQPRFRPRPDDTREREGSPGMGEENDVVARGGIQQVGKSVWVGREGEVTVEGWVLEWWEKKGYKGYHSEGSILTTLFALLMWPVLFLPLPGAFETPYQTAPLDLGEDTFAPSRHKAFEARLVEMFKTKRALELLREVDEREREKRTWAVGVNWEYGRDELEEILECLGGRAMGGICRMLGEEYRHRVSGVPDLLVWDYGNMVARFVEVKGPGDNLSETQKIWIDVLLSAGVQVEVCRVKAEDASAGHMKKRKSSTTPGPGLGKKGKKENGGRGKSFDKEVMGSPQAIREEEGDEDGDGAEFAFESGEEGKVEGHWERGGKRVGVGK